MSSRAWPVEVPLTGIMAGPISAVLLALGLLTNTANAQATLHGRVVDSEFGHGLAYASIRVGADAPLSADSLGQFEVVAPSGGKLRITIEAIGYASRVFEVGLPPSGRVEQRFPLDFTGDELPDVVVQARAEQLMSRYLDFERRRARGLGAYLRWDEIKEKGYYSVGDALRSIRGIRIQCDQKRFECFAVLARTPHCKPAWWIDGVQVSSFHENTPIRDVYGIEAYRGAGEIPGEFAGSNAACGVIVLWTKSRPFQ